MQHAQSIHIHTHTPTLIHTYIHTYHTPISTCALYMLNVAMLALVMLGWGFWFGSVFGFVPFGILLRLFTYVSYCDFELFLWFWFFASLTATATDTRILGIGRLNPPHAFPPEMSSLRWQPSEFTLFPEKGFDYLPRWCNLITEYDWIWQRFLMLARR